MCGISGAFAFSTKGQGALQKVRAANQMLVKRGPDGGEVFINEKVALGHRRLSIIDVSCAGDQPMHTTDNRYTIIFNGEIFNYKELRQIYLTQEEQQALRSHSDTEIFLGLFAKLKNKVFELLQGFFAAAIYDHSTEELVLVRDRYGKKPLLFYHDKDNLIFASEMKALFEAGVPRQINWEIVPIYFQLNYVPQPHSMVQGVQKLQPGHYLTINKEGIKEQAYYTLKIKPDLYDKLTYDEAKGKLVELMDDAVRMRLIADVPLGAFLSGGIDSSVIVALASNHTKKLNTFSIGYKDNAFFDETKYANLVAKKYKTEHTVFSLRNADFLEHVNDVLDYIDEPFADSSAIPVYILSYYTRKHVTVALSGDGGDEVFAGYNKHGAEWRMRKGGYLNSLVKTCAPLWSVLPKSRNNKLTNTFRQLHRFAEGANASNADRYWKWATFSSQEDAFSLFSLETRQKIMASTSKNVSSQYTKHIGDKDFNEVLLADMNLVLLSDMLVKVDLMSMANSLEVRSPFLDQEVVEFAFGLPSEYKIDAKLKKKIVQDAFRDRLPDELYNRPKHGFEIPLLEWFRNELWNLIDKDLLEENFIKDQAIFNFETIHSLKQQVRSNNPGDSHATIWALIVFQHWWKRYIAN